LKIKSDKKWNFEDTFTCPALAASGHLFTKGYEGDLFLLISS